MGFWNKLRKKDKVSPRETEDWEQLVYDSDEVDFRDEEQRSRYVLGCLDQIAEADRETKELTGEYALVTSYLTDAEEIEALPDGERKTLEQTARTIQTLEQDRKRYLGRADKMAEQDYQLMKSQEDTVEEGIRKLRDAETYSGKIRQDLRKLDVERQAHAYRKQELEAMGANYRGITVIVVTALAVCLLMLAVLQFVFQMNTTVGYFIAVIAGALALTYLAVKYLDSLGELRRIRRAIARLIQLQNRVKIRYVNNTNLLEYLRIKYNTDSSEKLEKKWKLYQEEREVRKQFAEAEARIDYYREQLISQLTRCRIQDPGRWTSQVEAILDSREMVEIRHELILRRQTLRKQLEYNKEIADRAREEIMELTRRYPMYSSEILEMVDKYQQESV